MGWNTEHLSICVKLDLVKLDLVVVLNELGLVFCCESIFKVTIDQNYYTRDKCIFICNYFSTSILGFIFASQILILFIKHYVLVVIQFNDEILLHKNLLKHNYCTLVSNVHCKQIY